MKTDLENELAYLLYRMWEGDDILDQVTKVLSENGFIDEDQEWIYPDEDYE